MKADTPKEEAPASALPAEDNWLAWLDNPSKSDLEWLEQKRQRDKRVGALLREMHYLEPHAKPPDLYGRTDEEYWTSLGFSAPGLDENKVRAELTRRKNEFSRAAAAAAQAGPSVSNAKTAQCGSSGTASN